MIILFVMSIFGNVFFLIEVLMLRQNDLGTSALHLEFLDEKDVVITLKYPLIEKEAHVDYVEIQYQENIDEHNSLTGILRSTDERRFVDDYLYVEYKGTAILKKNNEK